MSEDAKTPGEQAPGVHVGQSVYVNYGGARAAARVLRMNENGTIRVRLLVPAARSKINVQARDVFTTNGKAESSN